MKIPTQRKLLACAISCPVFLGACGGGEDLSQKTTVQTEAGMAASVERREQAGGLKPDSRRAAALSSWDMRIGPDDLLGESLPMLDPLTFVHAQAAVSNGLVSSAMKARAEASRTNKWNPGHYIEYGSNAGDYVIDAGLKETQSMPFVKGIMVRASWWQLEPRKGEYDFSRIDRYLDKATAKGKRLFLTLGTKSFNGDKAVPDYLRTSQYGGGAIPIGTVKGTSGENAALHEDEVRERLIALVQALGRRYNDHDGFEGITFTETAFGKLVNPLSDAQKEHFFSNLAMVNTAARQAFPNSVVLQFINYPANLVPALFENMKDKGVGMGGPDVFIDDPDLNRSAYVFNSQAAGVVPIGMKVESDSYDAVRHGAPYNPPDVRDLYRFARDRLQANYVFWYRYTTNHNPWQDVLQMFSGEAFSSSGTGGLQSACPSKFDACAPMLRD